jgi:Zn finger protein HypA/HybF involved in hydrogenase expression
MKILREATSGLNLLLVILGFLGIFSSFFGNKPFLLKLAIMAIFVLLFLVGLTNRRALRQTNSAQQFNTVFFIRNAFLCSLLFWYLILFMIMKTHDHPPFFMILFPFSLAVTGILCIIVGIKAQTVSKVACALDDILEDDTLEDAKKKNSAKTKKLTMKFECPHCEQHLEAPSKMFGSSIDCPTCNEQIQVPQSS